MANVQLAIQIKEPGRKTTIKFQDLAQVDYDKLMSQELFPANQPSAPAQKAEQKRISEKEKTVRNSVLAKSVPPQTAPKIDQVEFQPKMPEPQMWEAEKSDIAEKSSVQPAAVDLPKPVAEPPQKLSEANPEPIQTALADVKQNVTMAAKTKDVKAAEPAAHADYQPDVNAPADVVRKELAKSEEPSAAAPRADFPQDSIKKIQKEVDRKDPTTQINVQESHAERQIPQDDPNAWRDARQDVAEKHDVDVRSVALPSPVKQPLETLAVDRPVPIQRDLADVKQSTGLASRSAVMPASTQQPVTGKIYVPQSVESPQEVVRHESKSDYQPQSSAASQSVAVPAVERMARNVAAPVAPSSEVQVKSVSPAIDLPEVQTMAPAAWKDARTKTVAEQSAVQVGSVALPAAVSNPQSPGEILSDRSKPVEIAMASINPNVELRRTEAAGPATPDRPQSVSSDVVLHPSAAPVSVVRKKEARQTTVLGQSRPTDGLKAAGTNTVRDPSASPAVSSRAAVVPETAKASAGQSDLPQAPEAAPDKWVDSTRIERTALAEKSSITATAVNLPQNVDAPSAPIVTSSTSHYDIAIENVKSEFDVLPLSGGPAPAPGAPSEASSGESDHGADGSDHRKLIKSEEVEIPQWYEEKGINSVGTFRVHIGPDGEVQSVEVDKTTGFKDIDASWISAITNWKYESGRTAVTKLVKIRMMLKK